MGHHSEARSPFHDEGPPRGGPPRRVQRARMRTAAALCLLALLTGCGFGGPRNFENENDRLRAENLELQRQVETLETRLDHRLGEVKSLRHELADRRRVPIDAEVEVPRLASVKLGRYSGPIDDDDDGRDDAVVAYVRTLDQKGRFLPVAAEASLAVVVIDADEAVVDVLATADFDFEAFDAAFRSGLTGTHHTLRVPLPGSAARPLPEEVTLRVELSPAGSDAEFTAQRAYRVKTGAEGASGDGD